MLSLLPIIIEPQAWFIAFHRTSARRWVGWLACGEYKHVSAFAHVPPMGWVVFDMTISGTHLMLLPDSDGALHYIADRTMDADILKIPARKRGGFSLGFYCVPAIKHLCGIAGGALTPSSLMRFCLRQGAVPVGELSHEGKKLVAAVVAKGVVPLQPRDWSAYLENSVRKIAGWRPSWPYKAVEKA